MSSLLRNIFLIFSLFFCSLSFSQYKEDPVLEPIYKQARELRFTKPDSAKYLADMIDSLAQKKLNYQYMGMSKNIKGTSSLGFWKLDEAKKYFKEAIPLLEKNGNDSLTGMIMNNLGLAFDYEGNRDSSFHYFKKAIVICTKANAIVQVADTYNNMGLSFYYSQEGDSALFYYNIAIRTYESIGDLSGKADVVSNRAIVHYNRGDYLFAIKSYIRADRIYEDENLHEKSANTKTNIAAIHFVMKEYGEALAFSKMATENYIKGNAIQDKIFNSLNQTGIILRDLKKYKEARAYVKQLKDIIDQSGLHKLDGKYYSFVGSLEIAEGQLNSGLEYYKKALAARLEHKDNYGAATSYLNLAKTYVSLSLGTEAIKHINLGQQLIKPEDDFTLYSDYQGVYSEIYFLLGDYKKAFEYKNKYHEAKDSLVGENKMRLIRQYETIYETEKKENEITLLNKNNLIKENQLNAEKAEREKERTMRFALIGGLILVLVFVFFIYNRLKVTRKQKEVISAQKHEVEEQHQEISDSINYAKKIQTALLTEDAEWDKISKENMVLFKPKDVVSGDFFWAFHDDKKQLSIWVAADCTGHGVPGAFMSMLGIGFLNEIVLEAGVTKPSDILDELRAKIIKALEQKNIDTQQKDGMDLALCALDHKTNKLSYSGANNPLWIVNPNRISWPENAKLFGENEEGAEFKADKQPVGTYAGELKPFNTLTIQLHEGDLIYTFSDGFADQFGGEKGKKYKYRPFKNLLISQYNQPLKKQKEFLNNHFEKWRGEYEQIDDVCIVGIKIVS